jgi:hypothetical protein
MPLLLTKGVFARQMIFVSYNTLRCRTTQTGSILFVSEGVVQHEKIVAV